jgi:hypothetical protein
MKREMQVPKTQVKRVLPTIVILLGVSIASARAQSATASQGHLPDTAARSCLEAARKVLGSEAEVIKCGHLTGTDALETVAAIRLTQFKETKADGIPVSKLVILRRERMQWAVELTADKNWIRNGVGYIGIDFIDDSDDFVGYRCLCSGEGSQDVPGFGIALFYLSPQGDNEGIDTDINWNPAVGRFQEYAFYDDPPGFKPENKNPPHIRTRKPAR